MTRLIPFIFETCRDEHSESHRIIKDAEEKIKKTLQPLLEKAEVKHLIFVCIFHFLGVGLFRNLLYDRFVVRMQVCTGRLGNRN